MIEIFLVLLKTKTLLRYLPVEKWFLKTKIRKHKLVGGGYSGYALGHHILIWLHFLLQKLSIINLGDQKLGFSGDKSRIRFPISGKAKLSLHLADPQREISSLKIRKKDGKKVDVILTKTPSEDISLNDETFPEIYLKLD